MSESRRKFSVSDRVHHFQYGAGTITAIEENYTIIEFDKAGRKKFLSSMVQLEPTDTAAPVKPASRRKKTT